MTRPAVAKGWLSSSSKINNTVNDNNQFALNSPGASEGRAGGTVLGCLITRASLIALSRTSFFGRRQYAISRRIWFAQLDKGKLLLHSSGVVNVGAKPKRVVWLFLHRLLYK